jgi:hypothetical protein
VSPLAQSFLGASCFGASSVNPADVIINSVAKTTAILIMTMLLPFDRPKASS